MAKYSKHAGEKVERALHEEKEGTLKSGTSGKKVTSRKQAIAIGLSEARKDGVKVPPAPKKSGAAGKGATKTGTTSKATATRGAAKKSAPKKKTASKK